MSHGVGRVVSRHMAALPRLVAQWPSSYAGWQRRMASVSTSGCWRSTTVIAGGRGVARHRPIRVAMATGEQVSSLSAAQRWFCAAPASAELDHDDAFEEDGMAGDGHEGEREEPPAVPKVGPGSPNWLPLTSPGLPYPVTTPTGFPRGKVVKMGRGGKKSKWVTKEIPADQVGKRTRPGDGRYLRFKLTFTGHDYSYLESYAEFARRAAECFDFPVSEIVRKKTSKKLLVTLKSPFVHKTARDQWHLVDHKRVLKVYNASYESGKLYINYLMSQLPPLSGLHVREYTYEGLELEALPANPLDPRRIEDWPDRPDYWYGSTNPCWPEHTHDMVYNDLPDSARPFALDYDERRRGSHVYAGGKLTVHEIASNASVYVMNEFFGKHPEMLARMREEVSENLMKEFEETDGRIRAAEKAFYLAHEAGDMSADRLFYEWQILEPLSPASRQIADTAKDANEKESIERYDTEGLIMNWDDHWRDRLLLGRMLIEFRQDFDKKMSDATLPEEKEEVLQWGYRIVHVMMMMRGRRLLERDMLDDLEQRKGLGLINPEDAMHRTLKYAARDLNHSPFMLSKEEYEKGVKEALPYVQKSEMYDRQPMRSHVGRQWASAHAIAKEMGPEVWEEFPILATHPIPIFGGMVRQANAQGLSVHNFAGLQAQELLKRPPFVDPDLSTAMEHAQVPSLANIRSDVEGAKAYHMDGDEASGLRERVQEEGLVGHYDDLDAVDPYRGYDFGMRTWGEHMGVDLTDVVHGPYGPDDANMDAQEVEELRQKEKERRKRDARPFLGAPKEGPDTKHLESLENVSAMQVEQASNLEAAPASTDGGEDQATSVSAWSDIVIARELVSKSPTLYNIEEDLERIANGTFTEYHEKERLRASMRRKALVGSLEMEARAESVSDDDDDDDE